MTDSQGLDAVLEHVKLTRGFDFTGYKTASVERRITKRLEATGCESYADYLDYLEVHPAEFEVLFDTILINVTAFFRDAEAWEALRDDVLPELIERGADEPIRVWCAGCASGEEAYTIAILLCEALGEEAFRSRVKIYSTDVDEHALEEARQAVYSAGQLEGVPEELRGRYFTRTGASFAFRKDLRRQLIFGRNDLIQDAPISKVDLLTCRNTLMYFNAEAQNQILLRFHFALRPDGHLFMGKSEMLLTRGELFRPSNLRRRIFTPVPAPRSIKERATAGSNGGAGESDAAPALVAALDLSPVAQLVVDRFGRLSFVNEAARTMLDLALSDLGRPVQDLRASYRPAELRSALDSVFADGRVIDIGPVTADFQGDERLVEIQLAPIRSGDEVEAAVVHFIDVTPLSRAEHELERNKTELSAAYEELQSTIEELETTNEELQSTNEELETTNEELQSTNEELETMNEELQSSNEELETTNEELKSRSLQLSEANTFMDTILTSMGVGVILVDHEQRVRIWNAQSEEFWGVRNGEAIGDSLAGLDIGLPFEALRAALGQALYAGESPPSFAVDAIDRRGRPLPCLITVVPLAIDDSAGTGAIILTRRADDDRSLELGVVLEPPEVS